MVVLEGPAVDGPPRRPRGLAEGHPQAAGRLLARPGGPDQAFWTGSDQRGQGQEELSGRSRSSSWLKWSRKSPVSLFESCSLGPYGR